MADEEGSVSLEEDDLGVCAPAVPHSYRIAWQQRLCPRRRRCADGEGSPETFRDKETDELCDLLKSRVECPGFLEKLESAQLSLPQNIAEEGNSWDVISENDLWDGGSSELDHEDYVLVSQEDIMEGIACFVAAYLLSLNQTKDLTPNQLQEALSKAFSVNKEKGKLRKALDGSKVVYNVASWGATTIGIYQNPMLLRAASTAFRTSCQVISKLF
ncbi:uncharacterized protein LOC130787735 [Actinidia eriantha]|uniref:uncharacterized protein LOC130787735 n=1 Tax=Actinidia eriantha TaxID=165200 RepID=UPI00258C2FC4|nr:uncharacterized protein LOC130787735 [Actinidia eriantha]